MTDTLNTNKVLCLHLTRNS